MRLGIDVLGKKTTIVRNAQEIEYSGHHIEMRNEYGLPQVPRKILIPLREPDSQNWSPGDNSWDVAHADFNDGARAQAVMDAALQSAKSKQWVDLPVDL